MKAGESVWRLPSLAGTLSLWLPLILSSLLGLLGCATQQQQTRLQSEEETEKDRYNLKTIGDITAVSNAEPTVVGGVGLVVGLDGTGGEPAKDSYRQMLEDYLAKSNVKNIKELLKRSDVSLVVVSAAIPAGSNKNDTFDVQVALPPRTKATSLQGGYLKECVLFNYDLTKNLNPNYQGPQNLLKGHTLAKAEGPVLVGFGEAPETARQKEGQIWAGGRAMIDLPLLLLLNPDQQYARVASVVADRVNETLHGTARGIAGDVIASARNNLAISLRVPAQYRLNMAHYLRVVRLIPLHSSTNPSEGDHRSYRSRLAEDLLDPARTVTSALRLEALGSSSIPILQKGLQSKDWLVRFCSAESLAYLGSPSAGEELALAVERQPMVRAYALTALASLDEAVSQVKLQELLCSSTDDETRYGCFKALITLDERSQAVHGELLNDSFHLHCVAPNTPSLVHVCSHQRAEIVVFGQEPVMLPPFSFLAGDFTLTASQDDERCNISRIPLHGGEPMRKQSSLKLTSILRSMAELGTTYTEAIEMLRQANSCKCLSCRVRCDALPQITPVQELARAGKIDHDSEGCPNLTAFDLGMTPTLFEKPRGPRKLPSAAQETSAGQGETEPAGTTARQLFPADE